VLSFEMLDWALVRRTHSNKKRWWQPPSPSSLSSRRRDLFQGFPFELTDLVLLSRTHKKNMKSKRCQPPFIMIIRKKRFVGGYCNPVFL
jgi:hypothetical protein